MQSFKFSCICIVLRIAQVHVVLLFTISCTRLWLDVSNPDSAMEDSPAHHSFRPGSALSQSAKQVTVALKLCYVPLLENIQYVIHFLGSKGLTSPHFTKLRFNFRPVWPALIELRDALCGTQSRVTRKQKNSEYSCPRIWESCLVPPFYKGRWV